MKTDCMLLSYVMATDNICDSAIAYSSIHLQSLAYLAFYVYLGFTTLQLNYW